MLHKPWLPPEDYKAYHCVLYFHLLLSSCSVFVTSIFCLTKTVHLGEIDRSPGRFQLLAKHRLSSTGIGQFSMDNHRALETALPNSRNSRQWSSSFDSGSSGWRRPNLEFSA